MTRLTLAAFCLMIATLSWSCRTSPETAPDEEPEAAEAAEKAEKADEPGQQEAAEDAQGTYQDPQGRFSAPIPPRWTVEENEGYVTAVDPEGEIKVHMMAVATENVVETIDQMWPKVSPGLELEPTRTLNPPSADGLEDITVINYKMGTQEYVTQAIGWRVGDTVYLTLIEGDLVPIQKRGSQLNLIASGFQKSTADQRDLAGVQPDQLDDEKLAALEEHIEEMVELFGVPGTSIGIVQNGEVVYKKAFGAREVGGEPMTTDTLMMVGSTSKTMTTMLMAKAVDEGLMQWDTTARSILPEFAVKDPELTKTITLENLVCACTGVPRRDVEIFFTFSDLDAEKLIESLATFEFFTDFGEAFQYSNQMVATAGYVVAAARGSEWGELYDGYVQAMDEEVFGPIGMKSTTISFDAAIGSGEAATPYARGLTGSYESTPLEIERFVTPLAPAGAVWSNADDMSRYLITQLARGEAPDGERVVSSENLLHTWEPQVEINAVASYGLGWIVSEYKGQRVISHGGNTTGFTSELAFLPESDLGITILSNAGAANSFSTAVRDRLFELAFDLEPQAVQDAKFSQQVLKEEAKKLTDRLGKLDPKAVEPWVGTYQNDQLGEMDLRLEDDKLVADAGEFSSEVRPMRSEQTGELVYVTIDPPIIGAELRLGDDDGQKQVEFGQGVVSYTFTR